MVISMIAVGEQTGGLDEMLTKIADFYDDEVDVAVSALLSLMEPIMIVVLGVIVGGMVVAMYLPIFDMMNAVQCGCAGTKNASGPGGFPGPAHLRASALLPPPRRLPPPPPGTGQGAPADSGRPVARRIFSGHGAAPPSRRSVR